MKGLCPTGERCVATFDEIRFEARRSRIFAARRLSPRGSDSAPPGTGLERRQDSTRVIDVDDLVAGVDLPERIER